MNCPHCSSGATTQLSRTTEVSELVARNLPCAVQAVSAKPQPRLPSLFRLSSADIAGHQIATRTSAVVQVRARFVSTWCDTGNNPVVHQTHCKIEKPIQSGCVATTRPPTNRGAVMPCEQKDYAASPKACDTNLTWLMMSPLVVPLT